jgi:Fur family transcriptional regulator, ferric uptake regulator
MNDNINLNDQLKEKGYKFTTQRKLILEVIKENQGKHLSPESIYNLVKGHTPNIGIATVYRTLALLEKMSLIYKVELTPGSINYELNQVDLAHRHHHLICLDCGEVIEVKEDFLDDLEEKISSSNDFLIKDHSVKFYGYCAKCKGKYLNE